MYVFSRLYFDTSPVKEKMDFNQTLLNYYYYSWSSYFIDIIYKVEVL